jgi:glyoxylase-like metal-dependent hydrolase (beta-lactamase superfamily II)
VGTGELILIDPASPDDDEREALWEALEELRERGQRVVEIWLTHHHGDHVGAAAHFAERLQVPVAAHRLTAERLGSSVPVSRFLEDGERRYLSGATPRELEAVHTPGHAPGHLCFFEHQTRAMVAGDMVAAVGTILIDPSEGDMAQYLDSLEKMRRYEPRFMVPAHGFVLAEPAAVLDRYRDHRLMREGKVLAALGPEPRDLSELVRQVYDDTPAFLHGLAERSLLAHLLKLEGEGRCGKIEQGWLARA